jgi:uncharacterized membrane protein
VSNIAVQMFKTMDAVHITLKRRVAERVELEREQVLSTSQKDSRRELSPVAAPHSAVLALMPQTETTGR